MMKYVNKHGRVLEFNEGEEIPNGLTPYEEVEKMGRRKKVDVDVNNTKTVFRKGYVKPKE